MGNEFAKQLNEWYLADHRDLPFRRSRDPYAIWVSEVMAQQTRIESMLPYYERWMLKWPTITALANAQIDEVLYVWQGLGYYNRARKLHEGAKLIVSEYGGKLPENKEELLKIPGIGPYTAGAISSICFNQKQAAVDGNVLRVMARVDCVDEDIMKVKTRHQIEKRVESLMEEPNVFTQALMELGATLCTPKKPDCSSCPIQSFCQAYHEGTQIKYPVKSQKKKPLELHLNTYLVVDEMNVLLSDDDSDGLMKGLVRLPQSDQVLTECGELIGAAQHVFSHRIWQMNIFLVQDKIEFDHCFWWPIEKLNELSIVTAHRKILKKYLGLV